MGMIAQEVERELIKAKAMISAKMPSSWNPLAYSHRPWAAL